jgi:hypothetical protein
MWIARSIMAMLEDQGLRKGSQRCVWRREPSSQRRSRYTSLLATAEIPTFGEYVPDPYSICYEKDLPMQNRGNSTMGNSKPA